MSKSPFKDLKNRVSGNLSELTKAGREAGLSTLKGATDAATAASAVATAAKDAGMDKMFPFVSAPVYILHASADKDDYEILIQLDEVLSQIDAGVRCRPGIELISGRSDLDRSVLTERICHQFAIQSAAHEESSKIRIQENASKHRTQLSGSAATMTGDVVDLSLIGIAGVATGGLALLVMADVIDNKLSRIAGEVTNLPGALKDSAIETVTGGIKIKMDERGVQSQLASLKSALTRMSLTIHSDLYHLACSFDNKAYPMSGDNKRIDTNLPNSVTARISTLGGSYLPKNLKQGWW